MSVAIPWLRIEVGYELDHVDSEADPRAARVAARAAIDFHQFFRESFGCDYRLRWACGSSTKVAEPPPPNDTWVSEVLAKELNDGLVKNRPAGGLKIDEGTLLCLRRHASTGTGTRKPPPPRTGDHGTTCKLVGTEWVNGRSYEILDAAGNQWPVSGPFLVLATLVWLCPGAEEEVRRRFGADVARDVSEEAARSRGGGRRGGGAGSKAATPKRRRSP